MDEGTLLKILARIDRAEERLGERISKLEQFRAKVVGGALVVSGLVSVVFQMMKG